LGFCPPFFLRGSEIGELKRRWGVSDAPEDLWNVLKEYLEAERLELDDLEMVGSDRGGKVLRVTIGNEGLGVDRLSGVSRGISRLMDEHDRIPGSYTLEISTPGLERKLRRPEHWQKSIGRNVTAKTRMEIDGKRRHEGMLISADEESAIIEVHEAERALPYQSITSARTVFQWKSSAKPGKKQEGNRA